MRILLAAITASVAGPTLGKDRSRPSAASRSSSVGWMAETVSAARRNALTR